MIEKVTRSGNLHLVLVHSITPRSVTLKNDRERTKEGRYPLLPSALSLIPFSRTLGASMYDVRTKADQNYPVFADKMYMNLG